ncbi:MAG TPA: glycosyl hydrolase 53 family protein, partial [Asanoa sp.]|nr:glycosyl hydrolase 53 family protein [Asanoa sp.]
MARFARRVTVTVAALATLIAFVGTAAVAAPALVNPGFEAGLAGWKARGDAAASVVEAGGHTGASRLTHASTSDYRVETAQQLSGIANGDYTLRAWVRSSGDQRSADLVLRGCGPGSPRLALPRTGGAADPWVQVALGVRVSRHACTIVLASAGGPGAWLQMDDVSFTRGRHDGRLPIRGADVSHLTKNVDHGAVYRDAHGRVADPLGLLEANGVNYARLKVWVDPADGYNGKADVLRKARWAHARGMQLLIDFHYSDAWADPGKQNKPAAWAALPFDQLRQALYDHTYDVLSALRRQGTPAAMAQVGNEINGGLLWPDGRWDNWDGLAALLT